MNAHFRGRVEMERCGGELRICLWNTKPPRLSYTGTIDGMDVTILSGDAVEAFLFASLLGAEVSLRLVSEQEQKQ